MAIPRRLRARSALKTSHWRRGMVDYAFMMLRVIAWIAAYTDRPPAKKLSPWHARSSGEALRMKLEERESIFVSVGLRRGTSLVRLSIRRRHGVELCSVGVCIGVRRRCVRLGVGILRFLQGSAGMARLGSVRQEASCPLSATPCVVLLSLLHRSDPRRARAPWTRQNQL